MPDTSRTANSDVPAPTDGRSGGRMDPRRLPAVSGCDDEMKRALAALRSCRSSLLTARVDAVTAVARLYGARADRAGELSEQLANALAFCDRLSVIVEDELRADR